MREEEWKMPDLTKRELLMFVPLLVMILVFGIFPGLILDLSNETIMSFVQLVTQQGKENLQIILQNVK